MKDLAGKTAVVTGAGSGMGRAFAERFADAGMNVVLADVEAPLGTVAHDLELKVAAAGGLARMVRGAARGRSTRILTQGSLQDRKGSRRVGQPLDPVGTVRDDHEAVSAELERLRLTVGLTGGPPGESMGTAARHGPLLLQVTAGNVEDGFHVEVALAFPQLVKVDLRGVTEQPGGLVVERLRPLLELPDAQRDRDAPALGAESAAGRNAEQRRGRTDVRQGGCCHGPNLTAPAGVRVVPSVRRDAEYNCGLVKGFTRLQHFQFRRHERRCV